MKQLDPMVFIAVFQEMLGLMFWPMLLFMALAAIALVAVIWRDRGIDSPRLIRAELVGLAGGFAGVALMMGVTASNLSDLFGGPIDWLLTIAIWVAAAIGATIVAYVGMSLAVHGKPVPTA